MLVSRQLSWKNGQRLPHHTCTFPVLADGPAPPRFGETVRTEHAACSTKTAASGTPVNGTVVVYIVNHGT